MIKRTLYFGNPAYLSLKNRQLVIQKAEDGDLPFDDEEKNCRTIPVEDIGVVILDNKRITVTSGVLSCLLDNNVAVLTCDEKSMPTGLLLPLSGNIIQNERFRNQLESSVPLRKQLWKQTVEYKIRNQAAVLKYVTGQEASNMIAWAKSIKSGDSDNLEARAAVFYWKSVFPKKEDFIRDRYEEAPNNLLNYGYAILRAIVARSLVACGLLPTIGIHHHNRYNAYCLADDIMEPYRPYVDKIVIDILDGGKDITRLTTELKAELLQIPVIDVYIDGKRSPLMIATMTTASSLRKCFEGNKREILYPEMR